MLTSLRLDVSPLQLIPLNGGLVLAASHILSQFAFGAVRHSEARAQWMQLRSCAGVISKDYNFFFCKNPNEGVVVFEVETLLGAPDVHHKNALSWLCALWRRWYRKSHWPLVARRRVLEL